MSKKNAADRGRSNELARAVREEMRLLREDLEGASPAVRAHLQRLAPNARSGRSDIPAPSELPALLVDLYSYARATDRRAILDAGVRRLSAIAIEAAAHPRSDRAEILRRIGAACEPLVLEGTVYQQLVSAFAVKLGSLAADDLARLRGPVVTPLVRALVTLLRVGAPNTRDSAVEGLGALLKGVKDDAEKEAPFHDLVPIAAADASAVALQYIGRLKRRKTMSLTVAGHAAASREFLERLRTSVATVVAEIRRNDEPPEAIREALKTALYDRADLLRTLPALLRQGRIEAQEAIRYLRDDARLPPMREDEDESVAVAFARFQESVFRTIDVLIKREGASVHLDQSIAEAVDAIPVTIVGSPAVCNYQIRATIAILQAAVRLVERKGQDSPTWAALLPIFRGLRGKPAPWLNLGIAEGCYLGLPFLLANPEHDELVRPALAALFKHLRRHHDPDDYAETHRQLIANACFRRILIRRMELAAEHDPRDLATGDEAVVEHDVRALLLAPDTEHVLAVFRGREPLSEPGRVVRRGVAETLLSGIAFESDLLRRGAATFRRWPEHAPVDRVLLTRILAAELRASSQDARELARYSMLTRLYGGLPTITLPEEKRLGFVWDLLAALPPEAAGAADADLEDFVDHCGRRNRSGTSKRQVEDLPGHVLAMISDAPSDGIAAAIAREMDLNRRHERERDQGFDLGTLLYQVMLRGPDKSVFEHLLPRVDHPNDRALVKLFLHHVEAVQRNPLADDVYAMEPLLEHIRSILDSKEEVRSRTLDRLKEALRLYADLAADDSKIWPAIAEGDQIGGVGRLFSALDDIANETHKRASGSDRESDAATHRTSLVKAYEEASAQLQSDVSHYLRLPVGDFEARAIALRGARKVCRELETALGKHEGLQPPERILLVALMQRLRDLFERTRRWFCEEPKRRKESGEEAIFWMLFAAHEKDVAALRESARKWREQQTDPQMWAWLEEQRRIMDGEYAEALDWQGAPPLPPPPGVHEYNQLRLSGRDEPPRYQDQNRQFERFYVDWMASELRVDALSARLADRWSPLFRNGYEFIRRRTSVLLLLAAPCAAAAVLHELQQHSWEGFGFFLVAVIAIVCAPLTFLPELRSIVYERWFGMRRRSARFVAALPVGKRVAARTAAFVRGPEPTKRDPNRMYRLQVLLPRLARLIAVPMALVVELEHSYKFATEASTWVLTLLMLLAYLTTRFFIRREMIDYEGRPHAAEPASALRKRASQVMAVALAHSISIAVLFAIIFASSALRDKTAQAEPPHQRATVATNRVFRLVDRLYSHVDALPASGTGHRFAVFAGVLPRDVVFDMGTIINSFGREIPPGLAPHLRFTYYPTLIFTWAALGLFVGVFLEGFVGGVRLRGPSTEKKEPSI